MGVAAGRAREPGAVCLDRVELSVSVADILGESASVKAAVGCRHRGGEVLAQRSAACRIGLVVEMLPQEIAAGVNLRDPGLQGYRVGKFQGLITGEDVPAIGGL